MRRRRNNLNGDSLELLLDTICNTFGGVLFIAILLVVLLQLSPAMTESVPEESPSPGDTESLEEARERRQNLADSLQHQLDLLEKVVSPKLQNALGDMTTLQENVSEEQNKLSQLEQSNVSTQQRLAKAAADAATLEQRTEESRRKMAELRETLRLKQAENVETIHSPVERSAFDKSEVGFILRYGRLFLWHRYSSTGERMGLNTEEFLVVDDTSDGLVVRPRPGKGIPVDRSAETRERIASRLRQFSPREKILALVVRPDSFAEYRVVRDVAASLGFQYRLMPCTTDSPVVDRGGRGGFVQ